MIREMNENNSQRVLEIYKMGLETKNATFETEVPLWSDWDLKHHTHSRFVYVDKNTILSNSEEDLLSLLLPTTGAFNQ
jgi:L-amino acid N-acyltransferase YncA